MKRLLVLFFVLLGITACKKDDTESPCGLEVKSSYVEKEIVDFFCDGLLKNKRKEKIIINDSISYNHVFERCAKKPNIDYENKLYIGTYTSTGGCKFATKRYLEKRGDSYHYYIYVESKGGCEMLWSSYNLIELPKVDSSKVKIHVTICGLHGNNSYSL